MRISDGSSDVCSSDLRLLLVMATGTGKTYTAFQIIWRLWKAGAKKRILFLADRNILVDQTKTNDFKPFGGAMTKITNRQADNSYEVYLSLYQAVTGTDVAANKIGRAHVCTPVTNAHLVCRLLLEKQTLLTTTLEQFTSYN